MKQADPQREQARIRQARKRQRERVDRISDQADAAAETLPLGWRAEFLDLVRKARARADGARVEVEKTAVLFADDSGRQRYLKANYRNTKVSIPRLLNEFIRQKTKIAHAAAITNNELLGDYYHDECIDPDEIDWTDLNELAFIIGDEPGPDVPLVGTCLALLIAAVWISDSAIGAVQARELLRLIDKVMVAAVESAAGEEPSVEGPDGASAYPSPNENYFSGA
jgi:hypothetical protein